MAILKYLRVGDTAELADNGIRWIRIPSHVATSKQSGVIYESEDGTPVYTWFTDAHVMRYATSEPATESAGSTVSAAADDELAAIAGLTSAADKMIRYTGSGTAELKDLTDAGCALLDDASALVQTQTLSVEVGVDTQAYNAGLTNLAGVTMAANQYYYTSADDTHVAAGITANGRALVAAADYAAMLALLSGDASAIFAWNSQSLSGINDVGAVTGTFSGAVGTGALTVTGAATVSTTLGVTGVITATTDVHLDADDAELQLGNEPTDSYLKFDGTDLLFYDTSAGSYSLTDLAASGGISPIVSGDLSLPDGSLTIVDADSAVTLSVTNDTIVNSGTHMVLFDAGNLTDQCVVTIEADSLTTGEFLSIDDGGVQQFAVKRYGEIEILGADATDMITITKGHIQLDDGKIEIDSDSNIGSYIISNFSGQSVSTLKLHNNDATGTNKLLELIQDATGAAWGIDMTHDGDEPALYIHAAAARTGYVVHIPMANQLAERALLIDGASTVSTNEGAIEVSTTGVLAAGANLLRLVASGNQAADSYIMEIVASGTPVGATSGFALLIDDNTGATGTSYAVDINANANEALQVSKGKVKFAENLEIVAGGYTVVGDSTIAGKLTIGSSAGATNDDVKIFLNSANKFMVFDETADDIIISDATGLIFGGDESTADGVKFEFDGTSTFNIDALTANDTIVFGGTADTNVQFEDSSSNLAIDYDAGTDTVTIQPGTTLIVQGDATGDGNTGLVIPYHATASPSHAGQIGAIFFEVDTKKLWVNTDGAGNWVSVTLA